MIVSAWHRGRLFLLAGGLEAWETARLIGGSQMERKERAAAGLPWQLQRGGRENRGSVSADLRAVQQNNRAGSSRSNEREDS